MHKHLRTAFTTLAIFCLSTVALADPVAEVFTCKLHDGKTMEDAKAVNKVWLAWMRANVAEEITSTAATAVVGDSDTFMYVDTYPNLETWAKGKAARETDEGAAVESGFDAVMKCPANRLWKLQRAD
ncbi:MAG: hypothetical protein OEW73_10530 [Gammaproteobacteria bacterium]|nr:hypothetical protein [Gammaproteobacteria bacterium]MDH5241207.1 hypothetical protein [Gammaproteobacteria bacterium]MDH5262074.1 hypothetical protein [Gammaproteobacteria bacterium]MDH5622595.1 hypothetical protein [Gammaproteobacteria bacterium]